MDYRVGRPGRTVVLSLKDNDDVYACIQEVILFELLDVDAKRLPDPQAGGLKLLSFLH